MKISLIIVGVLFGMSLMALLTFVRLYMNTKRYGNVATVLPKKPLAVPKRPSHPIFGQKRTQNDYYKAEKN